jgi:hypothetical protein
MKTKRAMSDSRRADEQLKRLETGRADNQPKWPYWVCPYHYSRAEWIDIEEWMKETMGTSNWLEENARWVSSDRKYWFREEADRTFFLLRWS